MQPLARAAHGDIAEEDNFHQRAGDVEIGSGRLTAAAGVHPFGVNAVGALERLRRALELLHRRLGDQSWIFAERAAHQRAPAADKNRAAVAVANAPRFFRRLWPKGRQAAVVAVEALRKSRRDVRSFYESVFIFIINAPQ